MDACDINTRWQRPLITDGWTVKDSRSARTPSRLCHNVKSSWNMNAGRSSDGFCTPDPRAHPPPAGFINPSDWGCLVIAASFLDLAFWFMYWIHVFCCCFFLFVLHESWVMWLIWAGVECSTSLWWLRSHLPQLCTCTTLVLKKQPKQAKHCQNTSFQWSWGEESVMNVPIGQYVFVHIHASM